MRRPLKLHPNSVCTVAAGIEVEIARPAGGSLLLSYAVTGSIGDLLLLPTGAPARTDELWRHTCFEAFVKEAAGEDYYEFNFAPSGEWAAGSVTPPSSQRPDSSVRATVAMSDPSAMPGR